MSEREKHLQNVNVGRTLSWALDEVRPLLKKEKETHLLGMMNAFRSKEHTEATLMGLIGAYTALDDFEKRIERVVKQGSRSAQEIYEASE